MISLKVFLLFLVPLAMVALFFMKKKKSDSLSPEQNLRALAQTARKLERIQNEQEIDKLSSQFSGATVSANNPLNRSVRGF